MSLKEYRRKRDFKTTAEPRGRAQTKSSRRKEPIFVVHEHHARRLHFDLRLEEAGTLKSWAVVREPTCEVGVKTLAVETEDHPMDYARFKGRIPEGQYGAGVVKIWDHGTYEAITPMEDALIAGKIVVNFHGKKLKGRYGLIRMTRRGPKENWLFFKMKPEAVALKIRPSKKAA